MVSYNTDYVFPDLIDFLDDIEKELESRLKKKKEMLVSEKNIILTKNYIVASIFNEYPEDIMKK